MGSLRGPDFVGAEAISYIHRCAIIYHPIEMSYLVGPEFLVDSGFLLEYCYHNIIHVIMAEIIPPPFLLGKTNMKDPKRKNTYYFVDEAGDPSFYNKHGEFIVGSEGCSKLLMLGFVETGEPKIIRQELARIRNKIKDDPYLKDIPSLRKSLLHFHATDDCPEIRQEVYRSISKLNFKSQFVVARKIEGVFKKYDYNENRFYDSLIAKLFKNVLHKSENNFIYFSKRGSKSRQIPMEQAIEHAKDLFERRFLIKIRSNTTIQAQVPTGEPCLQVVDYVNWAVYRVFTKREMRYYNFIKDKVSFIWDIYDTTYPKNFYNKSNELDTKKISLL